MRQTEYLEGVLAYYRENDIIQGDPNEGKWEEAHTPLPRSMGDDTVLLLPNQHVIHDLWQSIELDECHFFIGDARQVMYAANFWPDSWFDLLDAMDCYFMELCRENAKKGGLARDKDELRAQLTAYRTSEHQRKAGIHGGHATHKKGVGIFARTPEQITRDAKAGAEAGRRNGTGVWGISREERRAAGRKSGAQIWESTIDGYRSTASGVVRYHKARGWDPDARVYIGQKSQ